MAVVATIQVLIQDDEQGNVEPAMTAAQQALLSVPGVIDARISDASGFMTHRPDLESQLAIEAGNYKQGQAFSSLAFELPTNRRVQTRALDVGVITFRVPMPWLDGQCREIDVHMSISTDDVAVTLAPPELDQGLVDDQMQGRLTFDKAEALLRIKPSGALVTADDVAFDGGHYAVQDSLTGRRVAGLVMSIPAVANFEYVSLVSGSPVHHGTELSTIFESRMAPAETPSASGNRFALMYLTDEGEIISSERTTFRQVG